MKISTIGRFWLVGLVGQKMVVGISNSFYVVFGPSLAPIPNCIQIGWKMAKLKIFTFGRFWLVGLVGRKMVVGISNSFYVVFFFIFSPHAKFYPNRIRNTEVTNFHFWSILVGRAGRSKNGRSYFKHSIAAWKVMNDLCTKFELNRMKNGRISPFLNFWLVGWLGRSVWVKLAPEFAFKAMSWLVTMQKFLLDSSKRSQVIPLQKSQTTTTTTPTRVEW